MIPVAIEDSVSTEVELPNLTQLQRYGSSLVRLAVVSVAAVTWVIFWGLVARLHVITGEFISALVVGVLFVLPAILGYAYWLRISLRNV